MLLAWTTLYLDSFAVLTTGIGSPAAPQIRNSSHILDNYMLILMVVFEQPAILNEPYDNGSKYSIGVQALLT